MDFHLFLEVFFIYCDSYHVLLLLLSSDKSMISIESDFPIVSYPAVKTSFYILEVYTNKKPSNYEGRDKRYAYNNWCSKC